MLRRILAILAALVIGAAAYAETLVVYPLASRDSFLGPVISDRVAAAFAGRYEVYGPAVAPSLVPPLPIGEGFLNPTEFLRSGGVANRVGADLLRDALGADAVLTGSITFEGDRLVAELFLAQQDGVTRFLVTEQADRPDRLASRVVTATARGLATEIVRTTEDLDLSGDDGVFGQALALVAAGLIDDARRVLERDEPQHERAQALLEAIRSLERGESAGDPALMATLAVNRQPLDERLALRHFRRLADTSELPAAKLWVAVLEASVNDLAAAEEHFAELPYEYPYGRIAEGTFLMSGGVEGADASVEEALSSNDLAALLGVAALATSTGDLELEKDALSRLTRVAPFFAYPFERLSFIAFDEEDALAAAEALAVAVELEPESDLYWTNLGWAYYLLGMLERSEQASLRALELDPSQYVAQYNLGLVQVVEGRLEEAEASYRAALRTDPEVDDAAVEDLEQALQLYPGEPAVHFALALLYEAEGRRAEAADQYRLYLERSQDSRFGERAQERIEVLSAPPPPIELTDGLVTLRLGVRGIAAAGFHPGDPLYPRFEIYTPGEELPQRLEVVASLLDNQGQQVLEQSHSLELPRAAVAYVVNDLEFVLPSDLTPGVYRLEVAVNASEGRSVRGATFFEVSGEPQLLRQLLGRNLQMQGLESGTRLYGPSDLSRAEHLTELLLNELHSTADAAEEALPAVEVGRFAGMSGGELFSSSTHEDVTAFLEYLLSSGVRDTSFVFAEAYAQWALEGAPLQAEE